MIRCLRTASCLSALAVSVPVALLTSASVATATPPSAIKLLSQSVEAANSKGSLTFSDTTRSGKNVEVLTGAVSAPTAAESLTETGHGPLNVLLIGDTIYVRGDSDVLHGTLGLPLAASTANSEKWISVQSGDSAFSQLVAPLNMSTELNNYVPAGHLKKGRITTVDGHKVIPLTGAASASAAQGGAGAVALFVSTNAPYLPVGGTLVVVRRGSPGLSEVAAFSAWGSKVVANAPTGAIPFSSLVSTSG